MGLTFWTSFVVLLAAGLYIGINKIHFEHNVVKLTSTRELTGKLAQTSQNTIKSIDKVAEGQIFGPECLVIHKNAIYSANLDGSIAKIVDGKVVKKLELFKNNPACRQHKCSQPLGIRYWKEEKFVFADGTLGIFVVDFKTEQFKQVCTAGYVIGKWPIGFADDFDFIGENTIVFSDMNPKCGMRNFVHCFMEYSKDGRIIKLNLNTGELEIIVEDILTPNGVVAHPDKQSAIVASSVQSQLYRVYYAGSKKGNVEVFADGLPGLPDNLRQTSGGKTFWIAFYQSNVGGRPPIQVFSEYPSVRKVLNYFHHLLLPLEQLLFGNHVVFVEMDFDGNVVSSVHDPEGRLKVTTTVIDDGKYLYFGNLFTDYIGRALRP
ncbi:unnamed protein product [Bursaphelenchus okinawaensis]|uniref:Strictosidine synthase conserved region domain-containing protein n=1 Tax=Bursaphelenchus okinawaensis TaxID=465554 RepID=A0A811KQW9_9BILA|nr:unnamed protein product [Bursaphelenchus okinawaensis]CAG9111012.1 unnamed protein product [Bursaphelenchus okinawaensis]